MDRTYTREAQVGKTVLLKGWVEQTRDLGNLKFFLLRDREGSLQVTLKKGVVPEKLLSLVGTLNREDCIAVSGLVKKSDKAPGGKELVPDSLKVVSQAQTPLPLDMSARGTSGKEKRFDYRFLDMRNPKIQALFRVRDVMLTKIRDFFESEGFVEVHTPVIQAAGAEGGATLFPLVYYKREAFLRQSPQLYKQMLMASSLDNVYEIGPAFRAEKFHTRRHVSEFLSLDMEMAWIDSLDDVLKVIERMVVYVLKELKKDSKTELSMLETPVTVPKLPFPRLTYDEVLKRLAKHGEKVKWGDDLEDPQEARLGEIMRKQDKEWYFITHYPSKIKPFYIMMDNKLSQGFDLACKGLEIASGGQREHRLEQLTKVMKAKGLDPANFEFFTNAFRYGMPPHGGLGFGVERFVQQVLGVENVKEIIAFPRTPEKLVP